MKRGGPPDRRQPLRPDPVKVREWQDRSRAPLASSELVATGRRASVGYSDDYRTKRKRPRTIPGSVRQAARARSNGMCVMCLWLAGYAPHEPPDRRVKGVRKIDHLHHVLPKGLDRFKRWATESANLIGLCRQCHDRHTNAAMVREGGGGLRDGRVPWEALPDVTVNLIARVGGPAIDYVARWYPRADGAEPNSAR